MSNTENTSTSKKTPKRRIERWEIWWYILFIFGPAAFIGPFVALFFALYFAAPEISIFLILAILGIIIYCLLVFFLLRTWIKAGDPNYKPGPFNPGDIDTTPHQGLNAGITGLALFHGLFGGHRDSDSSFAWSDLYWQEKYRHE